MNLRLKFSGSFPRSEAVARLYSLKKSNEIEESIFEEKILQHELSLLSELEKLNFDFATDGMLWADDIINPVVSMANVEIDGLVRFFDNNFFVRAPVVKIPLRLDREDVLKWYTEILKRGFRKEKPKLVASLPGPVTLASFSKNMYYSSVEALVAQWGEKFLVPIIEKLRKEGFSAFEIQEPSLVDVRVKSDVKNAGAESLSSIFERFSSETFFILTYFNSSPQNAPHLSKIVKNNSIVGIDMHAAGAWRTAEKLAGAGAKFVYLGVLNSRNPIPERRSTIERWIGKAESLGFESLILGNNAPMDFIPPKWALNKLRKLSRIVKEKR